CEGSFAVRNLCMVADEKAIAPEAAAGRRLLREGSVGQRCGSTATRARGPRPSASYEWGQKPENHSETFVNLQVPQCHCNKKVTFPRRALVPVPGPGGTRVERKAPRAGPTAHASWGPLANSVPRPRDGVRSPRSDLKNVSFERFSRKEPARPSVPLPIPWARAARQRAGRSPRSDPLHRPGGA